MRRAVLLSDNLHHASRREGSLLTDLCVERLPQQVRGRASPCCCFRALTRGRKELDTDGRGTGTEPCFCLCLMPPQRWKPDAGISTERSLTKNCRLAIRRELAVLVVGRYA